MAKYECENCAYETDVVYDAALGERSSICAGVDSIVIRA